MNSEINFANIDWSSGTPKSLDYDDIYYSESGGRSETIHNFINGNSIPNRLSVLENEAEFIVAETGFGTGSNLWILLETISEILEQNNLNLTFISFEKYPLSPKDLETFINHNFSKLPDITDLSLFLQHYSKLQFGINKFQINSRVTLILWIGDALSFIDDFSNQFTNKIDAWFLDGFAPSKNSDLWSERVFKAMYKSSKPMGTLATFTVAGIVRRGLTEVGYSVSKVPGTGRKKEILVGIKAI